MSNIAPIMMQEYQDPWKLVRLFNLTVPKICFVIKMWNPHIFAFSYLCLLIYIFRSLLFACTFLQYLPVCFSDCLYVYYHIYLNSFDIFPWQKERIFTIKHLSHIYFLTHILGVQGFPSLRRVEVLSSPGTQLTSNCRQRWQDLGSYTRKNPTSARTQHTCRRHSCLSYRCNHLS